MVDGVAVPRYYVQFSGKAAIIQIRVCTHEVGCDWDVWGESSQRLGFAVDEISCLVGDESAPIKRLTMDYLIDVVDLFRNDIELAETGHKYPFFSIQRSASAGVLKQLVKYDHQLIAQLDSAVAATTVLEKAIAVGSMESGDAGLRTIKGFLSTARGFFENRIAILKKVEKVKKVKK